MTRHLQCEDPIKEVSETLDVPLGPLHIHVHGPHIPSFWMRINDSFEQSFAAFRITMFIFQ